MNQEKAKEMGFLYCDVEEWRKKGVGTECPDCVADAAEFLEEQLDE